MNIQLAKAISYAEIRLEYRVYLESCGLAKNTVQTAYNDSFYLWNKSGQDIFWKVILDDDFENVARRELLAVLRKNTTGDSQKLINGYMSHLRRFRKFLQVVPEAFAKNKLNIKNDTKRVPMPCPEQLEHYLKLWNELENYHLQENALDKLFYELCPENKSISDILLKVATLNDFYSTNIFSVYSVAKHIYELDIDKRLQLGDVTLVNDIKKVAINGKTQNFYSFATKFCSHHRPLDYPIYDSYVEKVLLHFKKLDNFTEFVSTDLKNYSSFKEILICFGEFYGLSDYNLKDIDKYIWQLGKEYFPKNYKKRQNKSENIGSICYEQMFYLDYE
ncbi:hypothetical protein [Candidatus Stoquefichus massiliensis]|uniref:hypothetical protein n=1 Tax=Candidatus Stoquefichus massiliensis TaxID=1470350 RepID=UPI0004ADCC74|nr:hypothetical protein [Candidatus Stoquefichus massiliensis]